MLLHYLDNEVPWDAPSHYGEWDSRTEVGASTIVQSADAAFPERGAVGLRCSTVLGNEAYVRKVISRSVGGGESLEMGFWFTVRNPWASYTRVSFFDNALGNPVGWLYLWSTVPKIRLYIMDDAGGYQEIGNFTDFAVDERAYVVLKVTRATSNVAADGGGAININGALVAGRFDIDNYDRFPECERINVGINGSARDDAVIDFDEIKIATGYPEPFVPTPVDEYPQARRTVVLYRQGDADSREFADYCVSELGVPLANRCPLPNATADETLADYATFQTEVETDLAAWLALNPTVAANCSCFLIGHGVPGYFTHGGVKHSATSRLMNYGTAFSSQTDNPLYNPSTVARLTKTALGGKHLCSRIDADTLANAKVIIDRSLVVAALSALRAADKLHSDDATYRASLACRHLRIIAEALPGTYQGDDALVWGDTGSPGFHEGYDSRALFCDDSADSASLLRSGDAVCRVAITAPFGGNYFAAALGFSAAPSALCPTPFFEMLRIGGTLAEAFAVAIAKLDYTAVGIGSPLMTVAFQLGGYNVYRHFGGVEGIDWENPIAYLRPGQDSITLAQDLSPGQRYIYAVRSVSSAGIEERNTHVIAYAELDEQGILLPAPLTRPKDLTVEVQQSSLLIGFTYLLPISFAQADGFDILSDNGTGQLDLENPVATVEKSRNDRFDFEISIARPDTPVFLAVRARRGEQVGPVSEIVFVPLVSAPASIRIL